MLKLKKAVWDQYAIKAEIRRRGKTLTALAKDNGYSPSFLRASFIKPSTNVNRVIAQFVQVPLQELWPDWFDADGELIPARYRRKLSRQRAGDNTQGKHAA